MVAFVLLRLKDFSIHSHVLRLIPRGIVPRAPDSHAPLDFSPVDIGEERLDVLRPLGRLVVEEECVLLDVLHSERPLGTV
jgi:hypothetical protein